MTIIKSTSLLYQITIDCENIIISGNLLGLGAQDVIVRLLLTDIGVEAGADGVRQEFTSAESTTKVMHSFAFSGDIVRAALWLRTFRLVAMCGDGQTCDIALSSEAKEKLAGEGTSHRSFGHVAFHGNSWLFHNRADFTVNSRFSLPAQGDLPVFGILAAAFGDSGWFDSIGRPTAANFLDQIPRVFEAMAVQKRLLLLIDASNEGQPLLESWITLLHAELDRRGIPPSCCILLQQNRSLKQHYLDWCSRKELDPIRILVYDYYPRRIAGLLSRRPLLENLNSRLRQKRFCCLNFTPRPNRTSLVSWLLAKGFERESYISFGGYEHNKSPSRTPILCDWFPEQETVRAGLELLRARLPMVLDLTPGERDVPEYELGPQSIYQESYFSIVTETEVTNGEVVRITEKSIKPLAMYHPLIILGNPYSLRILKEYGFKTFHGFFNETYDMIEDQALRIKHIMAEIERLMSIDKEDLHQKYFDLFPTLAYNAAHARRVLNEQFKYEVEPALLQIISQLKV